MSDFLHSTDSQSHWRWWTRGFDSESRPTISDKFYIVSQKWQLHTLDKWVQCTIIDRILTMEWARRKISAYIHLLHTTRWKIVPPLPHIDAAAFASQQIIPIPQTADRKAMCTCRLYRHYVTTEQEHFATENKFNYLSKISQISFLAVVKSIHSYLPRWPRPPRYTSPPHIRQLFVSRATLFFTFTSSRFIELFLGICRDVSRRRHSLAPRRSHNDVNAHNKMRLGFVIIP